MGTGVPALWQGLLAGRRVLGSIRRFDTKGIRSAGGGEVPGPLPGEGGAETTLAEGYLLLAVREALAASGVRGEETALVAGTNFGGMSEAERALAGGDAARLAGYEFRGQVEACANALGLTGARLAISLSCASGAAALVVGLDLLRAGRAARVVAAGYDELSRYAFAGLAALRAMTPTALRPFDRRRDGTLFSEGAGALILEPVDDARARGATVYAELLGGALNNDGYHMTAPEKEARGISALVREALADAGVGPDEIDHVNLHGTGTKYNDLIETRAMKNVFGERARSIPVTACKSALGHAMGAAGALEAVAGIMSIREGKVPPTVGLDEVDPECDLDVVRDGPREVAIRRMLSTSYGIGGTNAAVVLAAPEHC